MRRWQSALRRLPAGVTSSEVSLQVKIASLEVKLGSLKVMTTAYLHLLMLCRNPSRSAVARSQQLRRTVMTRPGVITSSFQVGKPLRRTKHIQTSPQLGPICCSCWILYMSLTKRTGKDGQDPMPATTLVQVPSTSIPRFSKLWTDQRRTTGTPGSIHSSAAS